MKIGRRKIGGNNPCYVVLEIGSNHDGIIEKAFQLIEAASQTGADAVKFQLFRAKHLYPSHNMVVSTPSGNMDLFQFFRSREMPKSWLSKIRNCCDQNGIDFICTPFHTESIPTLVQANVDAIKIASPEINHIWLLEKAAQSRKPVIVSCGISKIADIEWAVDILEKNGKKDIAILHCVTAYPAPQRDSNLRVMKMLEMAFQCPVGLSDHSIGDRVPEIAAMVGAAILEKHFTLSRKDDGPDHAFAIEPIEAKNMIQKIRKAEKLSKNMKMKMLQTRGAQVILGSSRKRIAPSELDLYQCDSRSIYAARPILRGELIVKSALELLRSERNNQPGLHPRYVEFIVGKRAARDIQFNFSIQWEDIQLGES